MLGEIPYKTAPGRFFLATFGKLVMQKINKMSHGDIEKFIKSFPPALYFSFSLGILFFFFVYDYFQFSSTTHSILYVVFTIVNLPVGLGVFFHSYSYMREYKPGRLRLYIFPIPIRSDTLCYGMFILLGGLHLILFIVLTFIFILNGFSVPQPSELKNLRELL